jgi:hypothetical protein
MLKFHNYKKYRLPISINPLNYGKLIYQNINFYVMFINNRNLALIDQYDQYNNVKIFTNGELNFEYKDHKIDDNSFIRSIENTKFTFKNNKLISINKIVQLILLVILTIIFFENETYYQLMAIIPFKNIIKLRRSTSKNVWNSFTIYINSKIFTKTLFENKFNKFWSQIENKFTEHNHMFILFKIKYVNGEIATIGNLQRINNSDKDWYINWIISNMEFKSEYYNETQIDLFIISYGFKDGTIENKDILNKNILFQNYKNNNLPISMNPLDFGKVLTINKLGSETLYILQTKNDLIIKILKSENQNSIEIFKDANLIVKFTDLKLSENRFLRKIDNNEFYFENNQQILFSKESKTKFISKTNKNKNLVNNFITLDIETYIKDNILIPFCISIFDGKKTYSYFISDYKDSKDLILTALKSILVRKYNGYNIYIHNMAKFDIIFLLKYLVKLGEVQPIIHNGRIITINLNFGRDLEYKLQFKDSYLILLASLAKLTKGFMVKNLKSIFPFLFVSEDNLNYIGEVPGFKYFGDKIKLSEYNDYISQFNNNWNLRDETIRYCEIDCISLHQVIYKFTELIFNLFGKNVHHYPTLPSLAFAIFRSSFMFENSIPQLSGKIGKDIRQGYTGGAVDMYIPKGKNIYCYDVNSLYPFVMKEYPMPVGKPTLFEGDIRKIDPQAFGFFFCEIIAPDNIKHPILQTHVKVNNMIRTVAPLGQWKDMIFSAEMDNAMKFGYKFNILWGYKFDKAYIFKDYVEFLYNFRIDYLKSDPLNYIAKILLNSLYGRFGMDDNFSEINIIHKDYITDFENRFFDLITDKLELDDYFLLETKISENILGDEESTHNINVAIAAAITAYARIHMSQFKNNPNFTLYYSDTDSAYFDKPLPDYMLSDKILGKMKLEYICKNVIFLAPKVYCLETIDGKIIYKAKGLKHEVELTMSDFKTLLNKDAVLQKHQSKWFRNLSEGQINILEQIYTLKVTENKRKLIYRNSKLVSTQSYKIDKSKDIG